MSYYTLYTLYCVLLVLISILFEGMHVCDTVCVQWVLMFWQLAHLSRT